MKEIQASSGNVYADLAVEQAEQMLIKAQLADKIREIIQKRKLTQQQAAALLGIPQSKLSNMLRGQFGDSQKSGLLNALK